MLYDLKTSVFNDRWWDKLYRKGKDIEQNKAQPTQVSI